MFNRSGYAGSLGFYLFLFSFLLGFIAIRLIAGTYLLWHGVAAQGVVVSEQTIECGRSGPSYLLTVQFLDRSGQHHTSTAGQCDMPIAFNASPGSSITIVYLPDNPAVIASTDQLLSDAQFNLIATILLSLITLILLPFWIRKRIRKRSLHSEVDAGLSSTATSWKEQIKEETPQWVGGEEAVESGTSEIAPTMSPLLSGVQRVSKRIDRMMADAINRREALHWVAVVQLLEDTTNNPREIAHVIKLASSARDLQGLLQLHQNMLNRAAENNHLLHSLISEASQGATL